jgi:anti-sigma B factor antagonist
MGGENTTMFHGRVRENINNNIRAFVIDLQKVDWVNSVGLGILIGALTTVKNADGHLVLANIDNIRSLLSLTRLITVFDHFDSREEAIASFAE